MLEINEFRQCIKKPSGFRLELGHLLRLQDCAIAGVLFKVFLDLIGEKSNMFPLIDRHGLK